MIDRPGNINVFILYAAEDEELKSELEGHLSMLSRHGYIDVWHEGQIVAGEEKDVVISNYLEKSHIILLLISSNFLAPECYNRYEKELRRAYERRERGEVKIIPVILRHCIWQMDILGSLNPLPMGGHPVRSSHWENPDVAYQNIAIGLQKIAHDLLQATKEIFTPKEPERATKTEEDPPALIKKALLVSDSDRNTIAEQLINNLFSLFNTLDEKTCAQMAISIVHKSLVKFQELEKNFLKYKFLKAYHNAHLYEVPIKIERIKVTGRKSMGKRENKENGEEVMYEISRKEDIGSLPGHVRVFFPSSGDLPKISNLSL